MLGGITGGDSFEILVAIKDMTAGGFAKLRSEITTTEETANKTNLGGFSKAAKTAEADAEKAAGGIGGLGSGLMSLAGGPVGLAVVGIGAVAGAGLELTKTYEGIEVQEKALTIAAQGHGLALDDLNKFVDDSIKANEAYGVGASDTRGAITKLTEAGMSLADQQKAMGPINDLAKAKNMSLTDAAKVYELAIMGNAKALKEYGIVVGKAGAEEKALTAAQTKADTAAKSLTAAQDGLAVMEANLAAKHKTTAADALKLQQAHEKVTAAEGALAAAQDKVATAQEKANAAGSRSGTINDAITKAVGNQRNAVSPLTVAQAQLGDAWQKMAQVVGPPLIGLFAGVVSVVGFLVGKLSDLLGWLGKVGNAIANSPIGGFVKNVGGVLGGIGKGVGDVFGKIGSLIPHFAAGGSVSPRAGGTLAVLGEAGEREYVIPQSKMGAVGGGGGVMHAHLYLDGQEIAYTLERVMGSNLALRGTSARLGSGA